MASGMEATRTTGVPCKITGCRNLAHGRGLCSGHLYRERRGLSLEPPLRRMTGRTTSIEGNRAYQREWARRKRATNPEPLRAARRKWASGNGRTYTIAANARRRSALDAEAQVYLEILTNDPCSYCGARGGIGPDHIEPLVAGGDTGWANLTGACESCNKSKQDRSLLEHLLVVA